MNNYCLSLVLLLAGNITTIYAQSAFQNLDYESATVPVLPPNQFSVLPISLGLPGWSAFLGTNQQNEVYLNGLSLGSSEVSILGPNISPSLIIEGKFTALLSAGAQGDASISQVGSIPLSAEALLFKAKPGNGVFTVSLAGQAVQTVPLTVTLSYTLFGADISTFSGQSTELKFTAVSDFASGQGINNLYLDSISFSTQPIPEPGPIAIFSLGAVSLAWSLRKKAK